MPCSLQGAVMKKKRPPAKRGGQGRPAPSRADRWSGDGAVRVPEGRWYISGMNGVLECLESPHVKPETIWVARSGVTPDLWKKLEPNQRILEELRGKETQYGPVVQGIAALVREPNWPDLDEIIDAVVDKGEQPLVVALDQVEDPMNLGQILRTCEGAGVDAVLLPKHRSVHMNQTVAQISQGAFAWVPALEIGNLRNTLESLKERGLWVYGCESGPKAKSWHQCDFSGGMVLVMGAEGKGLRDLTRKTCDQLAELPMKGRINSLNVGAATAAFLYEVARQRCL